ncbi:RNA polymerase sigma factor [Enterococcus faecium]
MRTSLFQEATEIQFDYICKRAIKDERTNYRKSLARLSKKEITFSDIGEYTVGQFATVDKYPSDFSYFELNETEIAIENTHLGEALDSLPEKKRNIVLFYYFLEMNDLEIANLMGLSRSTVNEHRHTALNLIRKFIKENAE